MATDPLFRMTVQDVFNIRGRGTVVTGTIETGNIHSGDRVSYRREGVFKQVQVSGIESFRKLIEAAAAGEAVGLLLGDLRPGEIQKGDVLLGSEVEFEWKA